MVLVRSRAGAQQRLSEVGDGRVSISTSPVDKCVHGFGADLRKALCIKGLLDAGENLTKARLAI